MRICQHMEVWFFNPLCSNELSHTDFYLFYLIKLRWNYSFYIYII